MKETIRLFAIGLIATIANATTVTYDFNTGMDDSTSGGDLTAGTLAYAVGTQSHGGLETFQRAWDPVNLTSGNYLLNFTHRGLGNSGVADEDLTMTGAATLRFTLTPNSGERLDFSTSTLDFDSFLYTDVGAFNLGYKIWADTGSGFTALAPLQAPRSSGSGSEGRLKKTDESTDLPEFMLTAGSVGSAVQALSFDISSLGELAANQSVTLAIAMSAPYDNQYNFGNGIDNLALDVTTSISGPAAPVANDDAYDVEADVAFTNAAPGVLENDTDTNGDALTAILVTSPANGTLLSFSTNGSFSYLSDPEFTGVDSFTYKANDGAFDSAAATVSINVLAAEAPVANDDAYSFGVGVNFTNAAPGVLENDTDTNGNTLEAILVASPASGTLLSFLADGSFIYQPPTEYTGIDTFTYKTTDGSFTSAVATVTLTMSLDMSVSHVFNDDMILQRELDMPVWGKGNPGEIIEVSFGSQTNSATTDASGDWKVWLDPMAASTNPATLTVTGPRGTFTFANLLVGDVWICSGQSNMDWTLWNVDNRDAEIAAADYPNMRLMNVPTIYSTTPLEDFPAQASWKVCSPSTAGSFSGVGYFFGREIHLETGVPIGLIESAVGGTRIERWMPEDLRTEIGYTYDSQLTELYNGMIHPLTGFPVKGAIWYQGESNAYDSPEVIALYKDLLESMILGWRDAWNAGEFPFYFTQIAPHTRADELKIPTIWDAFTRTLSVPNTGMIGLNDLSQPGDISNVHPTNKQDVGLRFGLMALEKTYGGVTNTAYTGPLFDSAVATGSSVRVHFDPDTLGSGLASRDTLPLILFELAGADEVYFADATATITGDTVLVSHASVATPAFIRFGYTGSVPHNFMNTEGFPVDTFAAEVKTQSPPVAHPDLYTVSAGGSGLLDVLANDTDVENDSLSASIVSNSLHGTLVATNGMFLYTPTSSFQGTDRFTYQANDGTDDSQIVMVSVVVVEPAYPDVILPSMLGSNMVLQRNQPIPVWGWGPAGQTITVSLSSGQTTNTVVDAEGNWETTLPAMAATNGPLTLVVSTLGSSVTCTNLAVGDVWLAVGQSNMGWRLQFTDGGPEEVAIANYPLYRHFYTSKHPTNAPIDNIVPENGADAGINGVSARWTVCTPDTAKYSSAIAYYFARDLQQELDIPIGLIQSAYAGTAVEAWTKSVLPNAQPDSSLFIDAHELYNGMIHPWLKMPISGVIWRQGDSNRRDGIDYAEKVRIMVEEWRSLWNCGDFPFYYAQNPTVFTYEEDPTIPLFWEGQTEVMNVLSNSKMIIISDLSDGSGVHPKNKTPVGTRLADRALHNTYGRTDIFDSYPLFSSATVEGSQIRVHFDGTGSGLEMGTNGATVTWFEICGTDGIYTNATATIDGHTVVVSSPAVASPIGVRYLWSKYAIGNLFNIEGLPANSFRLNPPLAHGDSYGLHMDGELYVEPAGILANDETGSSRLPLQYPILGTPAANGTLMLREDGAFIYEPNTGFIGTDQFTYAVTDGVETSPEATVSINVLSPGVGTGQINRDVWTEIPGYAISDLTSSPNYPDSPDESGFIDALDAPQNWGDNYGQRIYGYLHPPTSGNYTFFISSSARSEFWLGTDDTPANLVKICSSLDRSVGSWTAAASPVALVGGQRYFIEVLHKENGGGDHAQVAWDLAQPGMGITNIVTGAYLSGLPLEAPATTTYAGWSSWYGVSGNDYLVDFAFNLDPTLGNYPIMVPTTGTSGLPYWEVQEIDGLAVEYLRRKDAPGTTYAVQFTDNLQSNWVDSAATETISPINSTWERVVVEDEVDIADATNRFGRVILIQE